MPPHVQVVLYILTSAYHSSSDFDAAIAKFLRKEMPDVDRDELPRMQVLTKLEQVRHSRRLPQLLRANAGRHCWRDRNCLMLVCCAHPD